MVNGVRLELKCFFTRDNEKTTEISFHMHRSFCYSHLEIFHCTHHPVIPESNLYFTFCSTLNALPKRTSNYLIALGNGMNPNRPINGCEINVRFCFVQYIKAVMYQELSEFIRYIRNVRIGSFFNVVYLYNAVFEFLFVMLNQK